MERILGDITVLELGQGIPGAYCGRLLAGLGARVVKVEPPGGEAIRHFGPFAGDEPDPEKSVLFLYLNTAKESITLDLSRPAGRRTFKELLSRANVVVESFPPGTLTGWGLDRAALASIRPGLILASITPFGQDGPYRDFLIDEIVAEALGGLMYTVGLPEREPLKIGGSPALFNAGGAAFSAVMAALRQRDQTGAGQAIDISIQEATAFTQIHASVQAAWQGVSPTRQPSTLLEAADGWASVGLELGVSAETWPRFCALIGRPELAEDARFRTAAVRRENREALQEVVRDWVRGQPKEAVYHRLQALRSIAGYVATAADLYQSRQLQARGFFQEIDHPLAGRARYPGPPFRIGGAAWTQGRAPLLGEHTDQATSSEQRATSRPAARDEAAGDDQGAAGNRQKVADGRAGEKPATAPEAQSSVLGRPAACPLSGVRVLDLTQVAIGPYTTFLLASLGAEVIKVESNRRPDTARGPVQPAGELQLRQYPHGEPGEHPWNRTAYFNQRNRGKLGITLDLSQARGKDIFRRLLATCDVLAENFRASVMERQGFGWDVVHAINPHLVYLKLSSQGNDGPERDYGSLGSTLEQTAGLVSITGYAEGVPLMTNETYPDPVGGILAAGALIAALRAVARGGDGMLVDFSQREMTAGMLGEAMLEYAFNGRVQGPIGNRHPRWAPQGVYPCRGDDMWIAIAVENDAQWAALQEAMGGPDWSRDPRFLTAAGRRQHHDEIDARLAEWTRAQDHLELMHRLQAKGVPAGAVLNGVELLADPNLNARSWWEQVVPTEIGEPYPFVTPPWRLSGDPYRPSAPAPCLGEHNDQVYLDLLGLGSAEYATLQAEGVVGTDPLWVRA